MKSNILWSMTLAALVCAAMDVETTSAESITLAASRSIRLVNPANTEDVRILCLFEIPPAVIGAQLLDARVDVQTVGTEEVPVLVAAIEGNWRSGLTWEFAAADLGSDPGFLGTSANHSIGSNLIELGEESMSETHVEVQVAKIVRPWIDGAPNFGLCIRGVTGALQGVSNVFGIGLGTPTLTLIYTRSLE